MRNLLGLLLWIFLCAGAHGDVPDLRGQVNDYANVLTQQEEDILQVMLEEIESYENSPQVVVLTVSSISGGSIEEYSIDVARTWGIGQREHNNGLLITILTDEEDFAVRLETGYGLEGVLSDARLSAIYNELMRPHFQTPGEEEYFVALEAGISAIGTILRGEETGNEAIDNPSDESLPWWAWIIILLVIIVLIAFISPGDGGSGSGWSGSSSSNWGGGSGWGGGGGGFGGGGMTGGR